MPKLTANSQNLAFSLECYREADLRFRENFLSLFTGSTPDQPHDNDIFSGLARLRGLAENPRLITAPLMQLERHMERAALTCDLLRIIVHK